VDPFLVLFLLGVGKLDDHRRRASLFKHQRNKEKQREKRMKMGHIREENETLKRLFSSVGGMEENRRG
jgi:hypothetical protein